MMGEVETTTCAMCHAEITGIPVRASVVTRLRDGTGEDATAYICGHVCSVCGDVICAVCKSEYLDGMNSPNSCPRCGNPWAPKRVFIRPYLERANRRLFDRILTGQEYPSRLPPPTPWFDRPRNRLLIYMIWCLILIGFILFVRLRGYSETGPMKAPLRRSIDD
ncbi:MAG: hypothetical protein AB1696_04365 [Planctomycetota bacterium]